VGAEEASAPGGALVFVGFMGAGKTSAARAAAAELGEAPLDADAALEAELGMPVAEFFERHGEAAFREREERVVGELLDRCDGGVVALGGGSVTSERVRAALGRHTVVWLDVEPDAAWQRASAGDGRPLARDRQRFDELHERRAPLYEQVADAILPPGERALVARALPALDALRGAPSGTRLVWAHSASEDYPVFIGPGLLASGFWPRAARRFCVTDDVVGPLYARALGAVETTVAIAAGEQHKTLPTAEHVLSALAAAGMTRADDVVALGGGVVGDLAGFCAATYQRGAGVVQVPTSLVAQVDSAYGGKTGVDLPAGKNYVGAYHQPALVLVDPALLGTLPEAELAAGYAEVLKTALIAGGPLWERVRAGAAGSEPELILACARTKLAVVARDERDQGARQALNLGHTVAHAIEAATGYRRYRHGEAVALGLLAALRLSGAERLREEVRELLAARGLPTALEADVDAVVQATARDKKRVGAGDVPFVLVSEPGSVQIGRAVEPGALRAAVAELAVR
jgi:shikimate kinase/3-dehydroquinate synthase